MESGATGVEEQKEDRSTGSRRKWYRDQLKQEAGAF